MQLVIWLLTWSGWASQLKTHANVLGVWVVMFMSLVSLVGVAIERLLLERSEVKRCPHRLMNNSK